ncbi:MAG: FxLYD domain-containing protein [Candidatus Bathyarchaeota archaeon]|nr:FxLYD domain-containing protein [Candidatus Bathyarchaeum sp.]
MKFNTVLIATVILVVTCFISLPCQPVQALGDVQIVSHSSFYNSLDTLYVVGELENTGDVATEFTKVTATFYGSDNQVIDTSIGYSTLDVLLPGRKSPFAVMLLQDDGAMDVYNYTLSVSWQEYDEDKPIGLEILSSEESVDVLDCLHITGEIKNTADSNANSVMVCATFYDSTGTVVGRSWEYADPSDMAPNQTGTFDVQLIYEEQIEKVASYSLSAESEEYSVIPEFPTGLTMIVAIASIAVAVAIYKNKLKD